MNGKFGELANQTNKPSDNTHLRNDEFDFLKSVSIFFLESELGQAAEWERTQCNRCVRVQMCTVRCASNMNLFGKIVEYNHRKRKGGRANERTILWMHAIVVYVSEFSNTVGLPGRAYYVLHFRHYPQNRKRRVNDLLSHSLQMRTPPLYCALFACVCTWYVL